MIFFLWNLSYKFYSSMEFESLFFELINAFFVDIQQRKKTYLEGQCYVQAILSTASFCFA